MNESPRIGSESECADSCIRLASGALIDLAAPDPELLRLTDIAQSLAHTIRFSGHCPLQPTVAQHSLAVEHIAAELWLRGTGGCAPPRELRVAALLHDAAEALVGDLAGPAKRWMREQEEYAGMSWFDELELRAVAAIAERFGVDFDTYSELVHDADVLSYRFESAYADWSPSAAAKLPRGMREDDRLRQCYGFSRDGIRVGPRDGGKQQFLMRARALGLS